MSVIERRSHDVNIYLVGKVNSQIYGAKLPSIKEVLSVFFFNIRIGNLSVRQSSALTIKEVSIFWEKSRVPIRQEFHCIAKLEALYEVWKNLSKSKHKYSKNLQQKRDEFVRSLDELFDIAHANALETMKNEEDKKFLLAQRQKGRPGFFVGLLEKSNLEQEQRPKTDKRKRLEDTQPTKRACDRQFGYFEEDEEKEDGENFEESEGEEEGGNFEENELEDDETYCLPSTIKTAKRGTTEVMTERFASVLDQCQISSRKAVHILMAAAEIFGVDTSKFIINRTSIHRYKREHRKRVANKTKECSELHKHDAVVLHFDGKLLIDVENFMLL